MDTTEDKDTHWVPWVAVALICSTNPPAKGFSGPY